MSSSRIPTILVLVAIFAGLLLVTWAGVSPGAAPVDAAAPAAPAASLTLMAQQDSWVNQGAAGTNYGTDEVLNVGRVSDQKSQYNLRTLVWFDLSELPHGATILTATLELYQVRAGGAERYSISPEAIFEPWDELKVTWNSMPQAFSVGDPASTLDYSSGWKKWDVTRSVQNWTVGEIRNYGLMLRGDGDTLGLRVFGSRESKTPPRLTIEYVAAPTATPTATAVGHGRIAYVYNTDTVAAANFQGFLQANGWTVSLIPLSQVASSNLSGYYAIILGHDTGSYATWGSPAAVAAITAAARPVIGVEQGGYSFFGKLALNIGYSNGATGGLFKTVIPANPAHPAWNTPFSIPIDPATGQATIYTIEQTITAIHNNFIDASNEPIGIEGAGASFNYLIGEKHCYMLWGYAGDPAAMTLDGKHLFLNILQFVGPWSSCTVGTPTVTPTPPSPTRRRGRPPAPQPARPPARPPSPRHQRQRAGDHPGHPEPQRQHAGRSESLYASAGLREQYPLQCLERPGAAAGLPRRGRVGRLAPRRQQHHHGPHRRRQPGQPQRQLLVLRTAGLALGHRHLPR
ncbi:MAG: DNRLRE domain-containing protein [Ardenticatenaceae bacterium]|nr:DNRLRE domain-containing protein [Ardenticatenaceae bacterium]